MRVLLPAVLRAAIDCKQLERPEMMKLMREFRRTHADIVDASCACLVAAVLVWIVIDIAIRWFERG